jgi:hypothetical protein
MTIPSLPIRIAALLAASLSACTAAVGDGGQGGSSLGGAGTGNTGIGTGGTGVGGNGTVTPGTGGTGVPGSSGGAGPGNTGTGGNGMPGTGGSGQGGGSAPTGSIDLVGSPQYFRFVRLTNTQWANSVRDILALPAASGLEGNFQSAVSGTTDFSNNELVLDVNQRSWTDFQAASEMLATQVTATDAALARVYTGTDAAGFVTAFGRRAYRRPLTNAEKSTYMTLFTSGSTLAGTRSAFAKGASLVIRAMLQSPFFLYRSEMGTNAAPLGGYEIAAKLALWLRGTTPNDALLDSAAGPGKLDTAAGAVALATTMMGEATAAPIMRRFHGELLHFDRYGTISKINVPTYKDALNAEYQESSYLFFDKIFTQGLGVRDILTATWGFVGPGMAALYEGGVAAPASGFAERTLGAQRVGYFSQLPFLTLYGFNAEPDSIHRGVSINLDVLCAPLGPPATVIPPVPPLVAGQTNRQRIDKLTAACGGVCHNQNINPMGFAFEHFDGMGQYHDTENGGLTIDSSGSYGFTEGTKSYSGAADLMQLLANGQQAHMCYAKKIASFGLQRDVVAPDMPLLTTMSAVSMAGGGSVKQVMLELVKHNAFRTRVGGAQ